MVCYNFNTVNEKQIRPRGSPAGEFVVNNYFAKNK